MIGFGGGGGGGYYCSTPYQHHQHRDSNHSEAHLSEARRYTAACQLSECLHHTVTGPKQQDYPVRVPASATPSVCVYAHAPETGGGGGGGVAGGGATSPSD